MRGVVIVGATLVVAASLGCTRVNPAYCDSAVAGSCAPGFRCDEDRNVCVSTGDPADAGHEAGGGADASADAARDGGADAQPECGQSSQCADPDKPICNDNVCQPCGGDGECLDRDGATPACVAGRCYECSTYQHCTTAGKPLCAADRTCTACRRDLECRSGPQPDVGVCLAGDCPGVDAVLWVDGAAGNCGAATGAPDKPFCVLTDAVEQATIDARKTIVVKPGTYLFFTAKAASLAGLLVVGYDDGVGGEVVVAGDGSHPAVDIDLVGAVTLRRLHLRGAQNPATAVLQCTGAACTVEEVEIDNGGVGVRANGAAPLTLARSRVHHNQAGGVTTQGFSSYVIENNFIYSNGNPTSLLGGVTFDTSYQTKVFVNNTVFGNRAQVGVGSGVSCDTADIVMVNNILWDNRDANGIAEVNRSAGNPVCSVTYSVVDEASIAQPPGAHNTDGNPLFVNVLVPPYDLHVQAGSSALGVANSTVAPADDIDGQSRPAGGPTDIGADQRQ